MFHSTRLHFYKSDIASNNMIHTFSASVTTADT